MDCVASLTQRRRVIERQIRRSLWQEILDAAEGTSLDSKKLGKLLSSVQEETGNIVKVHTFILKLHIVMTDPEGPLSIHYINQQLDNYNGEGVKDGNAIGVFLAIENSLRRDVNNISTRDHNPLDPAMAAMSFLSYWEHTLWGIDVPDA